MNAFSIKKCNQAVIARRSNLTRFFLRVRGHPDKLALVPEVTPEARTSLQAWDLGIQQNKGRRLHLLWTFLPTYIFLVNRRWPWKEGATVTPLRAVATYSLSAAPSAPPCVPEVKAINKFITGTTVKTAATRGVPKVSVFDAYVYPKLCETVLLHELCHPQQGSPESLPWSTEGPNTPTPALI